MNFSLILASDERVQQKRKVTGDQSQSLNTTISIKRFTYKNEERLPSFTPQEKNHFDSYKAGSLPEEFRLPNFLQEIQKVEEVVD